MRDDIATDGILQMLKLHFVTVRRQYGKFGQKLGFAIFDQAFFAVSSFIINILLARWMTPEQYGAFAVAYAWFLLPTNFYEAALIEPMNVFGAGKYSDHFQKYLGFIFRGHGILALLVSAVLLVGFALSYTYDSPVVAAAILGSAIAAPFLLMRLLTRFPFYVISRPDWPVRGSIIYLIVSVAGLLAIYQIGWLNALTAFIVMGLASLPGSIYLTVSGLKPDFRAKRDIMTSREIIEDHWDYGKWSTLTRAMHWITTNIYVIVLPMIMTLEASGAIKALTNLVMPIAMAISAMTALLLPNFARRFKSGGIQALNHAVSNMIKLYLVLIAPYMVAMVVFGSWVVNFLYNGFYDEYISIPLFIALSIQIFLQGIISILSASLRASGNVKLAFLSKILPTVVTLTVGLFLIWRYAFAGAIVSPVFVHVTMLSALLWYYRDMVKNQTALEATQQATAQSTD